MIENPYPVKSEKHEIWEEGLKAGEKRIVEKIGREVMIRKYPFYSGKPEE